MHVTSLLSEIKYFSGTEYFSLVPRWEFLIYIYIIIIGKQLEWKVQHYIIVQLSCTLYDCIHSPSSFTN